MDGERRDLRVPAVFVCAACRRTPPTPARLRPLIEHGGQSARYRRGLIQGEREWRLSCSRSSSTYYRARANMAEIIADLRDELVSEFWTQVEFEQAERLADLALATIKHWCAKEPTNDNEL